MDPDAFFLNSLPIICMLELALAIDKSILFLFFESRFQ
jgi:hypothetical protein